MSEMNKTRSEDFLVGYAQGVWDRINKKVNQGFLEKGLDIMTERDLKEVHNGR